MGDAVPEVLGQSCASVSPMGAEQSFGAAISLIKGGLRRKAPTAEVVLAAPRETGAATPIYCQCGYCAKNHRR